MRGRMRACRHLQPSAYHHPRSRPPPVRATLDALHKQEKRDGMDTLGRLKETKAELQATKQTLESTEEQLEAVVKMRVRDCACSAPSLPPPHPLLPARSICFRRSWINQSRVLGSRRRHGQRHR